MTETLERPILFSETTRWIRVAARRIGVSPQSYCAALNRGHKVCGGCMRDLPRDAAHFGNDRKTFDQLRSRCRECVSAQKKDHYERTRTEQRPRRLAYQRNNRERLYAYNAKWQRERHATLRAEMLAAYGAKCACCGESEPVFLELDHVNNDGAAHRREMGNCDQVMLSLRARGWPRDGFQILCCNCNQGKARNGGICPHVRSRNA
jgi:hypothetical protein